MIPAKIVVNQSHLPAKLANLTSMRINVYELSDGGSDTVNILIALCLYCHNGLHRNKDGEKYNQKLLEEFQRLENGLNIIYFRLSSFSA